MLLYVNVISCSDNKVKDVKEKQNPTTDIDQETSVLNVSQNTAALDEISSQPENCQDCDTPSVSELEASSEKEVAVEDSGETEAQLGESDGQQKDQLLKTETAEEENVDTFQEKELQNLPQLKESMTAETSAQKDAGGGCRKQESPKQEIGERDVAEAGRDTSEKQCDSSRSCDMKKEQSAEQGQGDAEENVESSEKNIEPELSVNGDQQTLSRL